MPESEVAEEDEFCSVPDAKIPTERWTTKKRRFCYWMARLGSITESLKRSELSDGYGPHLLAQRIVRDEIQKQVRQVLDSESENEESVIARWSRWANVDPGDFFDPGWILKDNSELTEEERKCIKRVKITNNQYGRNVDLELHDSHRANNDLGVMLGLLGRNDGPTAPPEETAKTIKQLLTEMQEADGLSEIDQSESSSGTSSRKKVTH